MPLNRAQTRAVRHADGPAMILAGPGSGKTTVITHRIRYLIEERKVDPSRILVITFTRAAAAQMKERFRVMMGGTLPPVNFGTFHSVFFRILRYAYRYTSENILKEGERYDILRDILRRTDLHEEDEQEILTALAAEISAVKGDLADLSHYYAKCCPAETFREICISYDRRLRDLGKIDFDDMMGLCYELLKARPDILQAWQEAFRYILIDEFQDINRLQYEIIRLLAAPGNNLFVVGDDDQSIYRFRGARPEIMLGFPKDYPDAVNILLDVNYRSLPSVVETAGRLIAHNDHRFPKKIHADRQGELSVEVHSYQNLLEENDDVIRRAAGYHCQGVPYEQIALLYRTNAGPRVMAEQLMRLNIPFQMADVTPNLYDHWITGDLLAYLQIAAGSEDRQDFLRILNRPKRYISREVCAGEKISLEAIRKKYEDRDWMAERIDRMIYDMRMLKKMRPWAAVNYIRKGIGYEDYIREYAESKHTDPDELLAMLNELQESARPFATVWEWMAHMEEVGRKLSEQKNQKREKSGIPILTMHAAKGLEFTVVFIMDANEGITPHHRALLPEDIEEERRLFYVAVTRAKTKLHICSVRERFHRKLTASRFLHESGF